MTTDANVSGFEPLYGEAEQTDGRIPWDIGGRQPAVQQLVAYGGVRGEVLDPGTGPGYHAIHYAAQGYSATGIDGSPSAIERAKRNAERAGVQVDFQVADATKLEGFEGRFDTVVDSAFYHVFLNHEAIQTQYAQALHRATKPGARLYMFEFSPHNVNGLQWTGIPADNFERVPGASGWHIDYLGSTTYQARLLPETFEAMKTVASEQQDEILHRMRPLVHRMSVIDPLLEDHRVHLPVWSVVSLAWTNRLCRARPAGAPGHQCAVVNDQHYVAAQTPGGPRTWQVMASTSQLRQGLSQRQLSMIALGGVIGAGLFVGSGVVIKDTGPAAFLTYALCGLLIVLVMRMLGEMAAANPSTGSFADYAAKALGGWAGFSVGWLYWYFWVIVVGFEAVAGGKVLNYWFHAPLWLLSLCLMVLMTATNLFSVSSFGEFEFWFAGIKVATIVIFLVVGTVFVFGFLPGHHTNFSNLTSDGGFFPKGVGAVFAAIVVVIFSMVGAEIVTVAAAESRDPELAVQRATRSVVARIGIFFVGSVFLLVVILPWNSVEVGASPYVAALGHMGLRGADQVMNAVVLTAVLSCLNSGLYTASRMLFVLADRRQAPAQLIKVSQRGVPYIAILCSSAIGFLCVIMAWVAPNTVFLFLLNSSGAIILFVYWLIALSQIILRHRTSAEKLRVKMWFFPVLSILTLAGMTAVLVQMAFDRSARSQLWLSLLSWAVVMGLYLVARSRGRTRVGREIPSGE